VISQQDIQELACESYGGIITSFKKGVYVEFCIATNLIGIFKGHLIELTKREVEEEEDGSFCLQLKGGFLVLFSSKPPEVKEDLNDWKEPPSKKKSTINYDFAERRK